MRIDHEAVADDGRLEGAAELGDVGGDRVVARRGRAAVDCGCKPRPLRKTVQLRDDGASGVACEAKAIGDEIGDARRPLGVGRDEFHGSDAA